MSAGAKGKVGIIGLGIMGGAMAKNMLEAGFTVYGFDVSQEAIDAFKSRGGIVCDSPRAVADKADVVILSLPSVAALDEVTSGQVGLPTAKQLANSSSVDEVVIAGRDRARAERAAREVGR